MRNTPRTQTQSRTRQTGKWPALPLAGVALLAWMLPLPAAFDSTGANFGALFARAPERNALYYLREGERHQIARDYRAAAHSFREAIKRNPGHVRAHLGAARANFALHDLTAARAHFERVLELEAGHLAAKTGLGRTLLRMGALGPAGELLREVRSVEPGNVPNNHALGLLYETQGQLSLAEAHYQRAIRIQPAHVESLIGMARVKAAEQRHEQSRGYLRRARAVNPGAPEIYSTEANLELEQAFREQNPERRARAFDQAYRALLTANQLAPEDVEIERQLIRIDLYRNRTAAAIERAESIVRRFPNSPQLLYMLATVQRGSDLSSAVPRLEQALRLSPQDSLLRFSLEELLLENSNRFPTTGPRRRKLARYHFERGRYYDSAQRRDLANYHFRRALQLYPFHRPALTRELERYRDAGDYELFIRTLRRLLKLDPDNLKLRNRLERALQEKNRSLAYRAGLFHAKSNPDQANYRRTPLRVFAFDFAPQAAFPAHPDGPDRVARALAFALDQAGPVRAVSPATRQAVLGRVRESRAAPGRGYLYGVEYRPEYIPLIEDVERDTRGQTPVSHLVSGSYRRTVDGFNVEYIVTDRNTGTPIDRFRLQATGRDALARISVDAARRITKLLGARGEVVRVEPNRVYVNLGRVDGLRVGSRLSLRRRASDRGVCRVTEISSYLSLCRMEQAGAWDAVDPGDLAVPVSRNAGL